MTLYLSKGRLALVYNYPFPQVYAGTGWTGELKVWNEAGALVPIATLGTYVITAKVRRERDPPEARSINAIVDFPSNGLVRWTFSDGSFANEATDVYRFIIDAELAGTTQRLVDSRLYVRGLEFHSSDYC